MIILCQGLTPGVQPDPRDGAAVAICVGAA